MISVITPVYNAEEFLSKCIESILIQKEVSEIILIDDGSTDNSWNIILDYSKRDKRIKCLKHDDHKNHGRSKTKNLGIIHSKNNFIGFLDADDFYLKDRFVNDLYLLQNPKIDGVYNAIGVLFYDSYVGNKNIFQVLTTLKYEISSDKLFENMAPFGDKGYFSGDGFIIRKNCLEEVGMFNENLKVAEDTDLWVKLSLKYKLVGGDLVNPVAIRGVHDNNVFNSSKDYKASHLEMYRSILIWAYDNNIGEHRLYPITKRYLNNLKRVSVNKRYKFYQDWVHTLKAMPKLIKSRVYVVALIRFILKK